MSADAPRRILVAAAVLLLLGAVAPGAAATSPTETAEPTSPLKPTDGETPAAAVSSATVVSSTAGATIRETQTLALTPTRPGSVEVTFRYELPETVAEFNVYNLTAANVTVVSTDGFSRDGEAYAWDGRTTTPTITARVRLPDGDSPLPFGSSDVDAGPWALVSDYYPYYAYVRWRYTDGAPSFERDVRIDGHSVAGDEVAYLGEHTTTDRSVDGRTLTLVSPAATEPVQTGQILDRLGRATRRLGTDGPDRVYAIPLPESANTTAFGTANGNVFWVGARGRYEGTTTWVHEYVHTQQTFAHGDATEWFVEGSADYYADLYAYYDGRRSFEYFLDETATDEDAGVVLAAITEPRQGAYTKGQRVVAALDQRVRAETDGRRSLRDVLVRLNRRDGEISNADIEAAAEAVTGASFDAWFDRYVTGIATPALPDDPEAYAPTTTLDTDGDGIGNAREARLGTDPTVADTDGDGLDDGAERDGPSDPTVADTDGDGLADGRELELGTDPAGADTDGDGLDDARETFVGSDPTVVDTDGDGLADGRELELGTDPTAADTDGDGLDDARERDLGTDSTTSDTDGDGLADPAEADGPTDPTVADTDGDGLADGAERDAGTDPTVADTDGDGYADGRETAVGTDPTVADTDGDGYADATELDVGTDPTAATGTIGFWLAKLFGL